jgi:hypothetical protein
VPRTNIRETYLHSALGPRPKRWGILQAQFSLDASYITDSHNQLLTRTFGWKVMVPLFLGMQVERNRVVLPDGLFSTNVSRFNLNVFFSPEIALFSFLQYDNVSKTLGWQTRFRWILNPGNEILVAWKSRAFDPLERFELTEGSFRIKFRYNYRF